MNDVSNLSMILGTIVPAVFTILAALVALAPGLTRIGNPKSRASFDKAAADLERAKQFASCGYEELGEGIEQQAVIEAAQTLAKKETGLFLDPMAINGIKALIFAALGTTMALITRIPDSPAAYWTFFIAAAVFLFGVLIFVCFIALDVTNFADVAKKIKAEPYRARSRKEGLLMRYAEISSSLEKDSPCILIDLRPARAQTREPIKNAADDPGDIDAFIASLPPSATVFACSSFGKESYEFVRDLRALGVLTSYDLGGIKGRAKLLSRVMIELYYRNQPMVTNSGLCHPEP